METFTSFSGEVLVVFKIGVKELLIFFSDFNRAKRAEESEDSIERDYKVPGNSRQSKMLRCKEDLLTLMDGSKFPSRWTFWKWKSKGI